MFKKSFKTLLIVIVVLMLAGFTYAFADANTVGASKAGDGTGTISGYNVTNIKYTLNNTNPTSIDAVSFTLDANAAVVRVRINAGSWYSCDVSASPSITCSTPGATVAPATTLQVVATN